MIIPSISPISEDNLVAASTLFNKYAEKTLPYKALDISAWKSLFYEDNNQVQKVVFQAIVNENLIGFAAGCRCANTEKCYITFVLVDEEYRRHGIGKLLLNKLEDVLCKPQITFFNPCALTWIIPGTTAHDHPNAPGVDINSEAFAFFKAMGYKPFVYQNSFYLPLAEYTSPGFIIEKKAALNDLGISLEYYNTSKHCGLEALCDDLGNPVWKEELLNNNALGIKAHPLMAAIKDQKIVGFTGPLRVQDSGRGYFAGIGVHSECRGLGLGTVLFHTLCSSLKDLGAEYMTLFTGTENPAGQIYQNAGFRIVKTWADMEKDYI